MSPAPRQVFRRVVSAPLTVSFDCYAEALYRKSVPRVPDYRILVVDYHQPLPDASQLARIYNQFPDQASPLGDPPFSLILFGLNYRLFDLKFRKLYISKNTEKPAVLWLLCISHQKLFFDYCQLFLLETNPIFLNC